MVKIAFQTSQIDVRGSCVALYDYALYNETILGNRSIIVTEANSPGHQLIAVRKFTNRFPVFYYENKDELKRILKRENCDIFYTIKYGKLDDLVFEDIKSVIHCVFDLSQPHGSVCAGVSKTLAQKYGHPLYVPHMIGLQPSFTKENLRAELKIPENARVFGRYGGEDTFNIGFVHQAIWEIINTIPNIYFLFANTPVFIHHSNVIFMDRIVSDEDKNRFIHTCDAHLECGTLGHSFGLAMGEFSVNNKPVIAYKGKVWNTAHYDILGDKALYFTDKDQFIQIITDFDPGIYKNTNMNCYGEYSPHKVMRIFNDVFIKESVKRNC